MTDWLIAIGTISLAVIAAFQDKIRGWIMRPKLDIVLDARPPDCHKTWLKSASQSIQVECYYFRLRVKNSGNHRAELVEVFATGLEKQQADDSFSEVESFLPLNLRWSHISKTFVDAISPGMEKHCDIGHIIDPAQRATLHMEDDPSLGVPDKTLLSFDFVVKPYTMSHLIPPGKYRLSLLIGASNTKPVKKTIEINVTGDWYSNEAEMLREGIGIRML